MTSRFGYAIIGIAKEPVRGKGGALELLLFDSRDDADMELLALKADKGLPHILRSTATVVMWDRTKGAE